MHQSSTIGSLDEALSYVDHARAGHADPASLIGLLAETASFLQGVAAADVERFRGYVLASFETLGLPPEAVPYVIEELQTGTEPYTVAAAAKAVLGSKISVPESAALLEAALARITAQNVYVQFEHFDASADLHARETAAEIVSRAIVLALPAEMATCCGTAVSDVHVEKVSSCCCGPSDAASQGSELGALQSARLQDQAGGTTSFAEYFSGVTGVLAFFYTRCMNPAKCSLTITNLAKLQRLIGLAGKQNEIRIGAITYDADYDLPHRLAAYGRERGLIFHRSCRMFRSPEDFGIISAALELGVGYGQQTVNRHQIELFLLDASGSPFHRVERLQWEVEDVFHMLENRLTSMELQPAS